MERRKLLWIVGVALFSLMLVGLVLIAVRNRSARPEETEAQLPGTVVIDNTDKLRAILLSDQYSAVIDDLVRFIPDKISPETDHAVVVGEPKVARNGNVKFVVRVDGGSEPFSVALDRSKFDKITLTIPAHSYKKVLDIY